MQGQAATLDVEHLMKVFDKQVVVRDVSFSLKGGELLTLLGPSGSGKTTTMRMIAGFEEPTAGDVRVAGESIVDRPVHKRDIGVVFQQYALFPHLSVFRNLAYPLEMRGLRKAEIASRVEKALAMVRLGGFEGRLPRELSGGQQQRVALARAIVFEPRLLLMDEPMGALDKRLRELMQVEIRQLQRQLGITTVSVTHDQVEALVMSDLIAVLDGGVLQQLGPPLEVYQKPVNRFVADFLGESNLIDIASAVTEAGVLRCRAGNGLETLAAPAAADAAAASWLVVRPENIQIGAGAEALPNHYRASVREALYVGDLLKYRVETETGAQFSIKALASAGQPWQVGDSTVIGWRTEHCLPIQP
ncbi:ABC transporter ATP-binding protein [Ferrovibrio sp. MS7]|uniref:ABC transporter ATP-binding protein n=1 Tax=Ferrovibrio plantarum TaxID=3119164 RepID=UPI003136FDB7